MSYLQPNEFLDRLFLAKIGDQVVYCHGCGGLRASKPLKKSLTYNYKERETLDLAYRLYKNGKVTLVQRRKLNNVYEYIAIKTAELDWGTKQWL